MTGALQVLFASKAGRESEHFCLKLNCLCKDGSSECAAVGKEGPFGCREIYPFAVISGTVTAQYEKLVAILIVC